MLVSYRLTTASKPTENHTGSDLATARPFMRNVRAIRTSIMDTRVYQLHFLFPLTIGLCLWGLVGSITRQSASYPVAALISLFLALISSLSLFGVWRLISRNEHTLFFGTYAAWLVIVPLIWALSHYALAWAYAYVVVKCCENSWFLHVTAWEGVVQVTQKTTTPAILAGLLVYVSLWLRTNISKSIWLSRTTTVIAALSGLWFTYTVSVAICEVWP